MGNVRGLLRLYACQSGEHFAKKVLDVLLDKGDDARIIKTTESHFASSEVRSRIDETVRDMDLYIFQDVGNSVDGFSVDENLMALKTAIDAARRSDAEYITAVLPLFPYSRQDKAEGRECITASLVAREIEDAGAGRVLTLDIHNPAINGFFRNAVLDDLKASKNFIEYIKEQYDLENMIIMPCDIGGGKRARYYARTLGTSFASSDKIRTDQVVNSVDDMVIYGTLEGKNVVIIDDMIDTGGSLLKFIEIVKEKGAQEVTAVCSLPLFNGAALERISEAHERGILNAVISTDVIYHGPDFKDKYPWFKEVSMASYFAKVIHNLNHRKSVSELLK